MNTDPIRIRIHNPGFVEKKVRNLIRNSKRGKLAATDCFLHTSNDQTENAVSPINWATEGQQSRNSGGLSVNGRSAHQQL